MLVTDGQERAALLNLARQSDTPGAWHAFSDILPTWLESYVGLEAAASVIRTYKIQFVPDMLQTEGYARALLRTGYPNVSEEEIARRSDLRINRQDVLGRPDGPQLWAVVDEAVLRRPIGGPLVMREQIQHLIKMTDHPALTLQTAKQASPSSSSPSLTVLRRTALRPTAH